MRATKIICTLGPAVDSEEAMEELIRLGMNGARFNFSHGSHESQLATYRRLCEAREKLGVPVAAILDTKGPEIRVGTFVNGSVELTAGAEFTLTGEECPGTEKIVTVSHAALAAEVEPGTRILIDDGLIELCVKECAGAEVRCTVVNGGPLSDHKSINVPGAHISLPAVTEKDEQDLAFAAEQDFDWVAASFVRSKEDVAALRRVLDSYGGESVKIMAKIENQEGVDRLDEILDAADGVMVARGDLGVEIPAARVPIEQKRMVNGAIRRGKVVVIATQMLDSMIRNPRPTRAEVSDVANAIFEGASCVMLSGETASGKYPFEALRAMTDTIEAAEAARVPWSGMERITGADNDDIDEAITHACCTMARDLNARAILTMTHSGYTARMVARFRPGCPIAAIAPTAKVQRQLAISWGVTSFVSEETADTDTVFERSIAAAVEHGMAEKGDTVVITAGIPMGRSGSTNLLHAKVVE